MQMHSVSCPGEIILAFLLYFQFDTLILISYQTVQYLVLLGR